MTYGSSTAARLFATLLIGLALCATACTGGGGKQATNTPEGEGGPPPTPVEIKIPGTEPVILPLNAALAADPIELARQTGYTSIGCASDQSTPQKGPVCKDGEDDGADVPALAVLACDGSWLRPEVVPDAYRTALKSEPQLFAIYVPKRVSGSFGADLDVQYVVVMRSGARLDGTPDGFALHVKEGRIVMLQTVCDSFAALVRDAIVDSYVVAPAG